VNYHERKTSRLVLLFNLKNLDLFGALRAKSFANLHFLKGWHKTSHMPTLKTLITNQHSGGSYILHA
jgi:hypothetical protein